VAEFIGRLDDPRNGIGWPAKASASSVRWPSMGRAMATTPPTCAGSSWTTAAEDAGVGRRLLHEAVTFCDQQRFSAIRLWTFKGLDAARRLYESLGFELYEAPGDQVGATVIGGSSCGG
jgi:hypothetical protein